MNWEEIFAELNSGVLKAQNGAKLGDVEVSSEPNVIPEGDLHKNKHDLDLQHITKKGIPVITVDDDSATSFEDIKEQEDSIQQHAEIEKEEIVFSKELTDYIEENRRVWNENNDPEILLEVGKRVTKEILQNTNDNTGLTERLDTQSLKQGGNIHIKESNKGSFTDYCGGKVTDECIQKGKKSPSAAVRKKAVFAENARTWKHALGDKIAPALFYNSPQLLDLWNSYRALLFRGNDLDLIQYIQDNEEQPDVNESLSTEPTFSSIDELQQAYQSGQITKDQYVIQRLINGLGINYEAAKGMTKVLKYESGLQEGIRNKRADAENSERSDRGIAQWQGPRAVAYNNYMNSRVDDQTSLLDKEIDFLIQEAQTRPNFIRNIQQATTEDDGLKAMFYWFENSTDDHQKLYNAYNPVWKRYGIKREYDAEQSLNDRRKVKLNV